MQCQGDCVLCTDNASTTLQLQTEFNRRHLPQHASVQSLRNHVSSTAALIAAAVLSAIIAATRDTPIDVRAGPGHFSAIALIANACAAAPILDAMQAQLHWRAVLHEPTIQEGAVSSGLAPHAVPPPVRVPHAPLALAAFLQEVPYV
jgi:hypothetical protein